MGEHETFATELITWRRLMALAADNNARLMIFADAARHVAAFVGRGFDRAVAADELTQLAAAHDFNADAVQWLIAREFRQADESGGDHVPDDIGEPQPANGKHKGNGAAAYARAPGLRFKLK